ncbi:hypothetical protein AOCH_000629, partial [Aspergillus ochraceoroseus]
ARFVMRMRFVTLFIGTVVFSAAHLVPGVAAEPNYVTVEQLAEIPDGWIRESPASPSRLMTFHISLHQENAARFEQMVIDMSTPGHDSYGRHMKRDDVRDALRPSERTVEKVRSWLESEHVPPQSIHTHGNWVTFKVPVSQAESLLRTQFHRYFHQQTGAHAVRTLAYSVPEDLHPAIQLIQPTTRFGHPGAQSALQDFRPTGATFDDLTADCSTTVTPDCLRELYGLFDTIAEPDPRNKLGISGYLDQYARFGDLNQFLDAYAPNQTDPANFTVVSINGGLNLQNSSKASTEASLDIQYAISLASNTFATYYTTGGRAPFVPEGDGATAEEDESTNEPYLEQLHYLLSLPDTELPAILSTSYGEDEQSVPESYANATCNLFAQLGARGVSVIFSSGDSGVGGSCMSNDGTNSTRFQPIFPASCPFVTSVGGTYEVKPERGISFSGGGFSDRFPRPAYQDASVDTYLESLGGKWEGLYNRGGRAIPDVAAQASNFVILDHGRRLKIGGTSAAAPVFAAVVSRLNAARLQDGQPRLGFLNPWLYSLNQTGFTDIVDGGSVGCLGDTGAFVPYASWNATPGWDPATGLGTPNYNTLVKVARDA